jgi:endonuclease-3
MEKNSEKIQNLINELRSMYGKKEWKRKNPPLDTLIKTILSQNTSDINSFRAFDNLKLKCPNWEKCLQTPIEEIEEAIRMGGLSKTKSKRIKNILEKIKEEKGNLDISFLNEMTVDKARKWLISLKGVGEKTAAVTLLFAFNKPIFPVDTHVLRVTKRLGLIGDISLNKAHHVLKKLISPEDYYESHLNLIEHGRTICHAQNPECNKCKLSEYCEYFHKKSILQALYDKERQLKINDLTSIVSEWMELDKILNKLEEKQIIYIEDKKINITELGSIYVQKNKKIDDKLLRNLLKKDFSEDNLSKVLKIPKKRLNEL